jgi:hypothetical protein
MDTETASPAEPSPAKAIAGWGRRRAAAIAVAVVALVAVGAAVAASKIHSGAGGSRNAASGPGEPSSYGDRNDGRRFDGDRDGFRGGPADGFGALSAASTYLGLSFTDLFTQLRSGRTLAQIAEATSGKSVDGLVAALVAAEQSQLKAAVGSGRLTQAQADALSSSLRQRFEAMVQNGFGGPPDDNQTPAPTRTLPRGTTL